MAVPYSIGELIEALRDGDFQTRNEAAVALGELGPAAGESVPALIQSLEAEDKYLRGMPPRLWGKSAQRPGQLCRGSSGY
jgi:HEAT repeat protein